MTPTDHCFREDNCRDHLDHSGPDCCCCGQLAEVHTGCDCDVRPDAAGFVYPHTDRTYQSAAEARDAAIDFQHAMSEQSPSYGELLEWQSHFEQAAATFPELQDEFRENGII